MGHRVIAAVSITATLLLAAAASSSAQGQLPRPGQLPPRGGQSRRRNSDSSSHRSSSRSRPQQQQSQQPAPARPYKPVAISAPEPMKDPSFEAFRKQLAAIAQRKDRTRARGLVVASGFFWLGENGDKADKGRSGIDNLAKIIGLDRKDASGWDTLAGYATDPTG